MTPAISAGMTVRHAGDLARVARVWEGGDGCSPRIDLVYLEGRWEGIRFAVAPESIDRVEQVATLRQTPPVTA